MELHGTSIIGGKPSGAANKDAVTFRAFNPALGQELEPLFFEASDSEIERAFSLADAAALELRRRSPEDIAVFLENIGEQIVAPGEQLLERASAESGLPLKRLTGERGRTVDQLRMFARIVREGCWLEATIDLADAERKPLPKPDLRRMLIPIGPVVVFGASNFPLAFSVAGGDTASALAAGNPVIVKAHPAHPGTSEMVASAIVHAAEKSGMPGGVFSLLQGTSHELSLKVVQHPSACAVGFTGSLRGGRAIFDAAVQRPNPIPVYAEMGSVNPVFVLPGALRERAEAFAVGLQQSVTLGVGQFCTCPGIVVGLAGSEMDQFIDRTEELFATSTPATMLHPGILRSYQDGLRRLQQVEGIRMRRSAVSAEQQKTEAQPAVLITNARTLLSCEELSEEVFGPSTVVVSAASKDELMKVARGLRGHLTATIHGTNDDLNEFAELIGVLQTRVGRLVFNGFPTGVEVCAAMHHGGPYPATTDAHWTSVGAFAIKRFARPICFQNFPESVLPLELQDKNHRNIWRMVDDQLTKDDCQ
ncbi:MAG: aldehyde dehydrogenase (NADP(+)) [Pyrinomonadaceae bacterium]|nr:aldehyde dehydrogenase (NADP(+)) [Pyrinomonadaceae bacterium]